MLIDIGQGDKITNARLNMMMPVRMAHESAAEKVENLNRTANMGKIMQAITLA
jgi:hypothetical protein